MSFAQLNLNETLLSTLTELNYLEPTPIQAEAIPLVLAGKDVMAGAQTGTGKTAAFALPIIQLLTQAQTKVVETEHTAAPDKAKPISLILTPTRELAQQVHRSFCLYARQHPNIKIDIAYGGVSLTPQIARLKNGADIIVATPGRLIDLIYKHVIDLSDVQHLVFDEADRMLDMGFMDEIKKILVHVPDYRQTLLFSATFDDAIFKLSTRLLSEPTLIEVDDRNTTANTIEQVIYNVDADRKRELTSYLIGSKNWQQVLIFTRTKQAADLLAKEMKKDGIKAEAIHGDKAQGRRDILLANFKSGAIRALIATDVAARGLDIQSLNYVINYELPHQAEDYIHRIGRTGRAGNTGLAISLMSEDENWLLEGIETLLDERIPQQWLPGYEPDLSKPATSSRKNSRSAQKSRAKRRGRR